MSEEKIFTSQCDECGKKIIAVLFSYPKPVAICVLPGVLASVMRTFSMPREMILEMLDSAVEDIDAN
jgi:hypothetical protein